jgi:hypothetical protein
MGQKVSISKPTFFRKFMSSSEFIMFIRHFDMFHPCFFDPFGSGIRHNSTLQGRFFHFLFFLGHLGTLCIPWAEGQPLAIRIESW